MFAQGADQPSTVASMPKFVARVLKTIHAQLATRARAEGVSLNALVPTFIAQGLGAASAKARQKGAAYPLGRAAPLEP